MITFDNIIALRQQIQQWKQAGLRVGFVPTMGNLHAGHISLLTLAKQHADRVVSSVFVNPLQFGVGEDFDRYPRTLTEDSQKLASAGCDALFAPSVGEMYPQGALQSKVCAPNGLTEVLEGASRPGHFDGVTTVVAKLFNLVQPDVAVFGQKDYQQWRVLQTMVNELNWPVQMIKAPIARDVDGLALSSRNQYLTEAQRQVAPKLYVVLQDVAQALRSGNQSFRDLERAASERLLLEGFDAVDYVAIVDSQTLQPIQSLQNSVVILAVARLGSTRLLDNIELDDII